MTALMGFARNYVDVAPPPVAVGGVLGVANVVDATDPHDLMGAQYLTDACATAEVWDEFCTMNPTATKAFERGPEVVTGDPFAVYAGVECDFQTMAEGEARARARLAYGEGRQVSAKVIEQLEADADEIGTGPYPINMAIGIAEGYLGALYGGVGTILIPRFLVTCACDNGVIHRDLDGGLVTCQGTRVGNVVSGNTFDPPGSASVASTIYLSGQITLLRGPVMTFNSPQGLGVGNAAPPRALAERVYVPLIECLVGKVEATCS